jgi:Acetylornithine deacetylase/Succinyl-diaminopimelate desuccinylase and related deacylases
MSEGVNWAGHDAQNMARVSRAGMIFIPSVNGRSHSKDEYGGDEDLVKGLLILLNVILALDSS